MRSDVRAEVDVLPFTRAVFWADLIGAALAGVQFVFTPDRTAEFASWTIALPIAAASLGYAYTSTLPSMVAALRIDAWRRTRILPVMALVLTTFSLVATFRDLDLFHFDEGPTLARVAAWFWMVLYAVLPVLNVLALVAQARASRSRGAASDGASWPLGPPARAFLLVHATALTVVGIGLYAAVETFDALWPFAITRLAAAVTGAFLLTMAAGSWYALRTADWEAFRLAVPVFLLFPAGQLLALLIFRADLKEGAAPWAFAAALAVWLIGFAVVIRAQNERRPAVAG
jgi:hypothetical protein